MTTLIIIIAIITPLLGIAYLIQYGAAQRQHAANEIVAEAYHRAKIARRIANTPALAWHVDAVTGRYCL